MSARPLPYQASPYRSASIEDHYAHAMQINDGNVGPHLPRLYALAAQVEWGRCIEFGVRRGGSSSALLMGCRHVVSYDIKETREARMLEKVAGERWDYRIESSLTCAVRECDLLFVDSFHSFVQCDAELRRHADAVSRWIVLHDSIWRGSLGEGTKDMLLTRSENPAIRMKAMGIRPAADDLMIRDPSWFIAAHYTDSCGLLVLERRRAA